MRDDDYCGFDCAAVTAKQQEILDEIKELYKVNPEFARVFLDRMIKLISSFTNLSEGKGVGHINNTIQPNTKE